MSTHTKRILALVLSVALCVVGLPANAIAEVAAFGSEENLASIDQSSQLTGGDALTSIGADEEVQDDVPADAQEPVPDDAQAPEPADAQEPASDDAQEPVSDDAGLIPIVDDAEQNSADLPDEDVDAVDALDEESDVIAEESTSDAETEVSSDEEDDIVVDDSTADKADADEDDVIEESKAEADLENADTPAVESADPQKDAKSKDTALEAMADQAVKPVNNKQPGLEAQASTPSIEYQTHVQSIGWQGWKKDGALSGTSGRSLRLEAMRIRLKNASGSVVYSTHAQTYGWLNQVKNGALSGTTGESKRLEAVRIHLTGTIAKTHDVWYRAHVQTYGWQNWVKNGQMAGTSGESKRVEALEILLVKKGDAIPTGSGSQYRPSSTSPSANVYYQTHVQTYGWQNVVAGGATAGTSGESKRLEAIRITLRGVSGGVKYRTHVQTYGWQGWRSNGALSGTSGESKRLEALQVKLTGTAAQRYNVWYRCHVQGIGWMGWAKNGKSAGTRGLGLRMEAVQIKLLPKGSSPSNSDAATSTRFFKVPNVTYRASLRSGGWQGNRTNGSTAGATGKSARIQQIRAQLSNAMPGNILYAVRSNAGSWQPWAQNWETTGSAGKNVTALRMKLSGTVSKFFDVWYRVHVANYGWLGWTKNGSIAGSDSASHPIEAYQVRIIRKGAAAPGTAQVSFVHTRRLNGIDISGWNEGINIAQTDAQFFIIKATEGISTPGKPATRYNPWYKTWANQVLDSGRLLGFYHYANGDDAVAEADAFYDAIKDYKGRAIACLDWEGVGNKLFTSGMDVAWCKKFLDRMKSRFGGTPFLYTSKSYTNYYDWSSVAKQYPLWGAEYGGYEDTVGYETDPWQSSMGWGAWGRIPTIFQYTGNGVLESAGTGGYFDFNLFYGNAADWTAYCK